MMLHQSGTANRHHDFNKSHHPPKALISSCHQVILTAVLCKQCVYEKMFWIQQ
jgi:hypothetical protein